MINEILNEITPLWEHLKTVTKPITIYGMGPGAEKILAICEAEGIPVAAVFASDGYSRSDIFRGFTVKSYTKTKRELGEDMLILLAFGTRSPATLAVMREMEENHAFFVPDTPVAGEVLFTPSFFRQNLAKFEQVYQRLADEASRTTYKNILRFKLSGKPEYLRAAALPRAEMYETILRVGANEAFVDAGAYNGDTIREFLQYTQGQYHSILAIEPSTKNFAKLEENTQELSRITRFWGGAWNKKDTLFFCPGGGRGIAAENGIPNTPANSIDNLLERRAATYIKYDVEGAEREALEGSRITIQTHYPKLLISAYHRSEDLFALPLQLLSMAPKYQLYFRHNQYLPAWDIHLLAIPKEEQHDSRNY